MAIEKDLRVAWFTLETLTATLGRAKADASIARTVARICRADLIVVDLSRSGDYPDRPPAPVGVLAAAELRDGRTPMPVGIIA